MWKLVFLIFLFYSYLFAGEVTIYKTSTVIYDPINQDINPKRIPGSIIRFTFIIKNSSDKDITDVIISEKLDNDKFEYLLTKNIQTKGGKIYVEVGKLKSNNEFISFFDVVLK